MKIQGININKVLIDDSQFTMRNYLFELVSKQSCQIQSFDTVGILYPVIVYEDNNKQLHLIDGKKRIQFAIQIQEKIIRATVLPEATPVTDIITLIFCNKRTEIEASIINKIQFICFAISLNASKSWILQSLCMPFEFKPHSDFLRECERIYSLPREMKFFCHEKRFSLKQLLNLAYYPPDLLMQLINWKTSLQLTASTLDEIASNLKDYLKRENKKMRDFLSEPEVEEIFESSISPRDKTEKLRRLIYLKRFPILSSVNARIQNTVKNLDLPHEININWDSSLENKNINLIVQLKDPKKWKGVLDTLNSKKVKDAITSILDEM